MMQTAFDTVAHIYKSIRKYVTLIPSRFRADWTSHISDATSIDSVHNTRPKASRAQGSTNRATRNSGFLQMEDLSIQEGREWGAR